MCFNSSLFWDSLTLSCYLIYNYHIMSTLYSHIISQIYWEGFVISKMYNNKYFYHISVLPHHTQVRSFISSDWDKYSETQDVIIIVLKYQISSQRVKLMENISYRSKQTFLFFFSSRWGAESLQSQAVGGGGQRGEVWSQPSLLPPSSLPSPAAIILPVPRWNEKICVMSRS